MMQVVGHFQKDGNGFSPYDWILKKAPRLLLPLLLLLSVAHAQFTTGTINGLISITGYSGPGGDVSIPSMINDIPVTNIGSRAFYSCKTLRTITFPDTVLSIGDEAFKDCSSLKTAVFVSTCPSMGTGVFDSAASDFTVYYFNSAAGFSSPTWHGYPAINVPPPAVSSGTVTRVEGFPISYQIIASGYTTAYWVSPFPLPAGLEWDSGTGLISGTLNMSGTFTMTVGASNPAGYGTGSLTLVIQPQFIHTNSDGYGQTTITGYAGIGGAVKIPSVIDGMRVISIANRAFESASSLTSVTIPDTVTSIGQYAFNGCSNLTNITIPNSVTSIGDFAFDGCHSLGNVTLPNKITSVGTGAFYSCTSLTGVTISGSVTSIGSYAFENCSSLASVMIPTSVTSIGSDAFSGCASLTSIAVDPLNAFYFSEDGVLYDKGQATLIQCPGGKVGNCAIPSTVASIGAHAFIGCNSLGSITVDESNSFFSGVDGVLFNKDKTTLIQCPGGRIGSYAVPSGVASIGSYAFFSCSSLTCVTMPDSVLSTGSYAFENCSNLSNVRLSNNITAIRSYTFASCLKLTSVCIPQSVTAIETYAFVGCTALTSVTIPCSVTYVGGGAFLQCSGLKNAVFLGNAPSMAFSVFRNTDSNFTVYYFDGATGFTSPDWYPQGNPQGGLQYPHDTYPAINMGLSSPVSPWLLSKGLPYNADPQCAPNGDGIPLLMKYALNLDPTRNQSGRLPQPVVAGNQMMLSYYAASAGVTYSVQYSTDLQTWTSAGVTVSAPDVNGLSTATVPITGSRCFTRLVVSR